MCDKIEAIESQLEEAINAINEINNDQIDSYHYILTSLEEVSKDLLDIKENYVAIEAVKPILDAIRDLTNEVSTLKRELKPSANIGCSDSKLTGTPKVTTVSDPLSSTKTITWSDIIKVTYNKGYIDSDGTHYTIKKVPDNDSSLKFIF